MSENAHFSYRHRKDGNGTRGYVPQQDPDHPGLPLNDPYRNLAAAVIRRAVEDLRGCPDDPFESYESRAKAYNASDARDFFTRELYQKQLNPASGAQTKRSFLGLYTACLGWDAELVRGWVKDDLASADAKLTHF